MTRASAATGVVESPRLLLVESDPDRRTRVLRALEATDLDVVVVVRTTLEDTARALKEHGWRWIVAGAELPDGSVRQVLEMAREWTPEAAVVVMADTDAERDAAAQMGRLGARDFISTAPADAARLGHVLRTCASLVDAERTADAIADGYRFLAEAAAELARWRRSGRVIDSAVRLCTSRYADFCVMDLTVDGRDERKGFSHRDPEIGDRLRAAVLGPLEPRSGPPDEYHEVLRVDEGLIGRLAGRREALDAFRELAPAHALALPLRVGDRRLGSITFAGDGFDRLDVLMLSRFADVVALALENAGLFERLESAVRQRDRVLAIVAHDLRNPLTAITSVIELLGYGEPTLDSIRRKLDLMSTAAGRMTRLVDDLVEVSGLERDEVSLRLESVAAQRVVDETLASLSAVADESDVRIRTVVASDCPPVRADPTRAAQVLGNLVENAIRACPPGGEVAIEVALPATHGLGSSADAIVFEVRNPGEPISAEEAEHLFEPFWQSSRKHLRGRAGLGLSIARRLAELQGGEIGFESTEQTTRFWFSLPRAEET